jgi:uncharacterized protein YraI/lysophospholipase L1-like esterase
MLRTIIFALIFIFTSLMISEAQEANARVINMWEMLNMRAAPSSDAEVVGELAGRTALIVLARSRDNRWFQVQTLEGLSGWVGSGFVELRSIELAQIPIVGIDAAPAPITVAESTISEVQTVISSDASNGRVTAGTLNLRSAPTTSGQVVARLPLNTRIIMIGRNADFTWLQIQTLDGLSGWVSAAYIAPDIAISTLPVMEGTAIEVPIVAASAPELAAGDAPYFILGAASWNIFARGQALGNRRTVFSKVGDSITVAEVMYRPFGFGIYTLGDYAYLQTTIDFFMQTQARDNNSFNNTSMAAQNGWTTSNVLNPQFANQTVCNEGESPLACEYRTTKASVALIMFGSNDVAFVPSEQFAQNLRVIVEYSIANGVVPVLSTIPPRRGYEPQVTFYNQLITQTASQYGISLWDYGAALRTLPNDGLSADGLHPSAPPEGFAYAANFTGNYLQYGYVMRNLTALQALDVLRRRVLQ